MAKLRRIPSDVFITAILTFFFLFWSRVLTMVFVHVMRLFFGPVNFSSSCSGIGFSQVIDTGFSQVIDIA